MTWDNFAIENCTKYSFDFKSKNYYDEKSNSAKFKGNIDLLIDDSSDCVLYFQVKFSELWIDLCTTESWFKNKNSNFKLRENLFNFINEKLKLNLKQINRKDYFIGNQVRNMTYKLNQNECKIVNEWFEKNYNSTLKNIVSILKGNNVGGSFLHPSSAELIWDSDESLKESEYYSLNLIMFLDAITFKNQRQNKFDILNFKNEHAKPIINWIKKIKTDNKNGLFEYFNFLKQNENTDKSNDKNFRNWIQDIYNKNSHSAKVNYWIRELINKERSKVSTININVFEKYQNSENAHIYPVSKIKIELESELKKLKNYSTLIRNDILVKARKFGSLKMINDENNLLNLCPNIHTIFDKNMFYYDEKGQIVINNIALIHSNDLKMIKEYYSKIPEKYMNKERKKYIKLRNKISLNKCV
ncbi:HNH endonuclease [Mycoplasmopsis caviae]|uniref:HNH endonuclease n=1 Tax=Mycoplasmopsis caviae TaxID=55603 RepID=A0A3P8MDK4_9BACT|nr:HNH endonuclease signature motif containing protein [Mycoplasmopsis caviae]UUD35276.1 HNH endonuclease [Mycoplasmopsis caviae]VDR41940.1 Uncharacterised protein [Mycoplasmopsis caviae]